MSALCHLWCSGEMVVTRKVGIGIVLVILFTVLLSLTWKTKTVYGRGRDTKTPRPLLVPLSPNMVSRSDSTTPNSAYVLATPTSSTMTKRPPMTVIERLTKQIERIPTRGSESKRFSRIMYLVQTESCLPKHLSSANGIGDTNTCQCDVLVLSYKQQCNEIKPPEHVEYLFNSSASWNVGRNFLLEVAKKRDQNYLYYTLMDDDITLKVEGTKPQNPWRFFENFLRELEPALASIRLANTWISNFKAMDNSRTKRGCSLNFSDVDNIPTPFFDPAINAFHHEAVEHILPYTTRYDNVSWWWSGWYAGIRSEIKFPGQVVAPAKLLGINDKHRPYPRKSPTEWHSIVGEAGADLPEQYRNVPLYEEWRRQGPIGHFLKSTTLCLPPARPHMMIKPFAYLEQDIHE